jgi:cyclic pyranopterin phosphate synthase
MGSELTHLAEDGSSRMVDVSQKDVTLRTARSTANVRMNPQTLRLIRDGRMTKGNVLEIARLAGIMAAKRTGDLIPLCHPLALEAVDIAFSFPAKDTVTIEASASITAKTGVEMEAMVAASTAALTIYDMCKAVDRSMTIESLQLEEKTGGRSGRWERDERE